MQSTETKIFCFGMSTIIIIVLCSLNCQPANAKSKSVSDDPTTLLWLSADSKLIRGLLLTYDSSSTSNKTLSKIGEQLFQNWHVAAQSPGQYRAEIILTKGKIQTVSQEVDSQSGADFEKTAIASLTSKLKGASSCHACKFRVLLSASPEQFPCSSPLTDGFIARRTMDRTSVVAYFHRKIDGCNFCSNPIPISITSCTDSDFRAKCELAQRTGFFESPPINNGISHDVEVSFASPPPPKDISPYRQKIKALIYSLFPSGSNYEVFLELNKNGTVKYVEVMDCSRKNKLDSKLAKELSSLKFDELPDWYKGEVLTFKFLISK